MIWVVLAAGIILASLVFAYALCRAAALADLHAMSRSVRWTPPTDVEIKLSGGFYDHERRGDFDV